MPVRSVLPRLAHPRSLRALLRASSALTCVVAALSPTGASAQHEYPQPAQTRSLPLLSPFPVVRIVGRTTPGGAHVRTLTVRARVGATVLSQCVGARARCTGRIRTTVVSGRPGTVRLVPVRAFERPFPVGTLLRVYVVGAGRTGKFTTFKILRGQSPRRRDGCVAGLSRRPIACPLA